MESFIIYVKIFTYAIGHPEEFYQETYIIKAPTDDKSKEEKIGLKPTQCLQQIFPLLSTFILTNRETSRIVNKERLTSENSRILQLIILQYIRVHFFGIYKGIFVKKNSDLVNLPSQASITIYLTFHGKQNPEKLKGRKPFVVNKIKCE